MTFKPGCNRISYQELAKTPDGRKLWDAFMAQVTEIALQHPEHFFSKTARKIIPEDAQRHQLYAYLRDDRTIEAFCIASLNCGHAELLWANCRKNRVRKMMDLYDFIEGELFKNVSSIVGMCCTEDTLIKNEDGELIDGCNWSASHRFHEKRGYRFTHRLDDYWEEGSHAFVFMKLKKPRRYGYTKNGGFTFKPGALINLEDTQLDLNKRLYKQIWQYLDVFDEMFSTNCPPEEQKSFVTGKIRKGFTGLALFNCNNNTATLFATTSSKPELASEPILKFEYDIDASALTQMLASKSLKDDTGILHYQAKWDSNSEIQIREYCERVYPSLVEDLDQRGFTVFYARRMGIDGHKSVLYFVTPEIENVVWYKPLWEAFAKYSFALILEIYSYFSSLLVLDASLRNNDYFLNLIQAISPTDDPGSGDEFHRKITRMQKTIHQRIHAHYWAVVRSKNTAFGNTGHLMANRCSSINKHLRKYTGKSLSEYKLLIKQGINDLKSLNSSEKHMFLAMQSTQNLLNWFQSLLLWGFDSLDEVWEVYEKESSKLDRYFKSENSPFDLSEFLYNETLSVIETRIVNSNDCLVILRVVKSKHHEFWLAPEIIFPADIQRKHFRLSNSVLSTIFYEIFLNAVRYGFLNNDPEELSKGYVSVTIFFDAGFIGNTPVFIVTNDVKLDSQEAKIKYKKIPVKFESIDTHTGKGLGLVAHNLAKLRFGNIWVRRLSNNHGDFYEVAVGLKGLGIKGEGYGAEL